ncbi:hypothetical protein [Actinoplanes derwentensis]|uniref:Lipoprotein LprG n=1 Tax=Actinoplanes derwentensis TaxID=113562 RepID=A0A1H1ZQH7_9ACTN|nr:hypothetical protein [Actinoplanes derwentensis]GID89160.1 hypothetical protein Ade03nite_80840 [Actinoplanes derwentensis]SDT35900.1 hypothetical protein SAMN04489716_3441 [Actinoplanes derwentensis]
MRKRTVGGAMMLLAVGGCAGAGPSDAGGVTASASPSPVDAAVALVQARAALESASYRFATTLNNGVSVTGVVDPRSQDSETVMTSPQGTLTIRKVDGVNYVLVATTESTGEPGTDGTKWVNATAEGGGAAAFEPATLNQSLSSATEVRWADDDTISGVIDMVKVAEQLGGDPTALAGKDTRFPFEADIDAAGRLVEYQFIPPAGLSATSSVTYSDFGTPVALAAPPASEVRAP